MKTDLGMTRYRSLEQAILNDIGDAGETPATSRLRDRWNKRFIPDTETRELLDYKAKEDFIALNDSVVGPWPGIRMSVAVGEAQWFIRTALERYTKQYSDVPQQTLDFPLLYSFWRFGPGSSRGVAGTHFVDKIRQAFTCTARCFHYVLGIRNVTPRLKIFDSENPCFVGTKIVSGSKLGSVGKNAEKNRTIATEPLGNMAIQLAAGIYIQNALAMLGLDICKQEGKNKYLAWLGSLFGHLCTIDLKSASDLISTELIKLLWPPEWYYFFMDIRSSDCDVTLGKKPPFRIKLKMMSTMGNGFTFPMMTLTLLGLMFGLLRSKGLLKDRKCDWDIMGVYGDDIIIPTEHFSDACQLLEDCGLSVNTDKSYSSGPFRESCGGDFYVGEDITPFYIESLNNDSEIYVAINKCLKWCAYNKVFLHRTLSFLTSLLRQPRLVPEWESPDSGILSKDCPRRYKLLKLVDQSVSKYICNHFDLLAILGGYVEPVRCKGGGSRGYFMKWTPRRDDDKPVVLEVKDARMPQGFLDGHDPNYWSRDASLIASLMLGETLTS